MRLALIALMIALVGCAPEAEDLLGIEYTHEESERSKEETGSIEATVCIERADKTNTCDD